MGGLKKVMQYRTGFGFDVHRFTSEKSDLVLGGITIKYPMALEAVSDGDVVIHSICDAVCGAACLGDIGDYFPPEDNASRGISSTEIACAILEKISGKYTLANIDVTIVAERPRLASYKKEMTESLRAIFKIPDINIKIKSKEKLDILGGLDSIACMTVVLLGKDKL